MDKEIKLLKSAATTGGYYVPDVTELSTAIGVAPAQLNEPQVTIPSELFKLLLRGWLVHQFFDEAAYRKVNPDVDAAIKSGEVKSGRAHYVSTGYFEGRSRGAYSIDANWYRRTYPDVAMAERKGQTTLADHYANTGRLEGRAASEPQARMMEIWRHALNPAR